jgi:hypothetical protein
MRVRGKPIGTLTGADLEQLVANRVAESRTLDYKETLPGGSNEQKKDFLSDVTAFANSGGGAIIYGVGTERDAQGHDTGIAAAAVRGLGNINLDQEILRLQSMLHDGVSPSLASLIRFQPLTVEGADGPVLALGVPRSLLAPHRVTFNRTNRFVRRSEAGNYEPDVPELRRMFLESGEWLADAERWRADRVVRVRSQAVYQRINPTSVTMLHVLPLGRLDEAVPLSDRGEALARSLRPMGSYGHNHRYNADGFLTYFEDASRTITTYSQVLRFGGIEAFSSDYAVKLSPPAGGGQSFQLWAGKLEKDVLEFLPAAFDVMERLLEREPPYVLLLGIYGVRGARIPRDDSYSAMFRGAEIDVDDLIMPPVLIEDARADIGTALGPAFDMVWQSGGHAGRPAPLQR